MPWDKLVAEFQDGDILYGLDKGRGEAKLAILAQCPVVRRTKVVFCCISKSQKFERILIQNDITNSVFDALGQGVLSDKAIRKDQAVASDPARALGFKDFLSQHPKYSVNDYKPGGMDKARQAWLKTSKAGLAYQTQVRGARIHFVLDGLDFDRVLAQVPDLSAAEARTRVRDPLDITSAEVRWLFRNRKEPRIAQNVTFWKEGEKVEAPWLWESARYKFANFLYTKQGELQDEADATEFNDVIRELQAALLVQRAFRKKHNTYYVRERDTLEMIASQHRVTVHDLRTWNNLSVHVQIKPGDVLRVAAA